MNHCVFRSWLTTAARYKPSSTTQAWLATGVSLQAHTILYCIQYSWSGASVARDKLGGVGPGVVGHGVSQVVIQVLQGGLASHNGLQQAQQQQQGVRRREKRER